MSVVDVLPLVLLVVGVAAGAVAQGTSGIGFALLAAPACALVLPTDEVVGTVVRLGLLVDLAIVVAARRDVHVGLVGRYLAASALAVPLALPALTRVDNDVLVLGAALLALLGAAAVARGARRVTSVDTAPSGPLPYVAGFAAGFFGITTGMSGPPVAVEATRRGLSPATTRTSLAAYFAVVDATSSVLNPTTVDLPLLATLAVAAAGGLLLGRRLAGRVPDERVRHAVVVLVGASAIAAIVRVLV